MYEEVLIAGSGGQGIIFAGRLLAKTAMEAGWHVACAVSYGPEMRGGTANSTVIISSDPIGSLVVVRPTIAIVMNEPSLVKFEPKVAPGGLLIANQSLVTTISRRTDIKACYVPATRLAKELGKSAVANVILLGTLLTLRPVVAANTISQVLSQVLHSATEELRHINQQALELGRSQGAKIAQEVS